PGGPRRRESPRLVGGIAIEDRRLVHIAAPEPHDGALLQVDGGGEDHGGGWIAGNKRADRGSQPDLPLLCSGGSRGDCEVSIRHGCWTGVPRAICCLQRYPPLRRSMRRLDFVDSLRGLAAIYVVVYHMLLLPAPNLGVPHWAHDVAFSGGTAVTLFFI